MSANMSEILGDYFLTLDDWMSKVNYCLFQYWHDHQDQRTVHLPLVDISPIFVVIFFRLYYVLVTKTIPEHMRDRKPYDIRGTILFYNTCMSCFNLWALVQVTKVFTVDDLLNAVYPSDKTSTVYTRKHIMLGESDIVYHLGYIYLVSKLFDLLDTVFFALRKKDSQITLLHLYHHISVPVLGWLVLKINPFIPAVKLFAFMNTFIHFVMYFYYFLTAFGPKLQPYLWWKRYITVIQLAQFVVLGIYAAILMFFQQGYPLFWLIIGIPQPFFFFYMFYEFYRKTYNQRKQDINNNNIVSNSYKNGKTL